MRAIQPRVQACYDRFKVPGGVMVTVRAAKEGQGVSVVVSGDLVGTPTATCVETAVLSFDFPAWDGISFPWPFVLRARR